MGLLFSFVRAGSRTRFLRLGFAAGDVALGVGLVLLRLAFLLEPLVVGQRARGFFHLALGAFDDAARARLRSALVVCHDLFSKQSRVGWLRVELSLLGTHERGPAR